MSSPAEMALAWGVDAMEAARLIVRTGRAWLPLTGEDVERGARAVVSDPTYRDELTRCALRRADEDHGGDIDLAVRILRAYTTLQLNDHLSAEAER